MPPDYVGTWRVVSYVSGECDAPELADFAATHVQIDVDTYTEQSIVQVFPCIDEDTCDTAFSAYSLQVDDARTASGVEEGFSNNTGYCDFYWVRAQLVLEDGRITITETAEGNADEVTAINSAACGELLPDYDGPVECFRSESLVLE